MRYKIINDVFIGSPDNVIEFKRKLGDFLRDNGGYFTDDFLGNGFDIKNGSLTLDYDKLEPAPESLLEVVEFAAKHSLAKSVVLLIERGGDDYSFEKWSYLLERDVVICQKGNLEFSPIPDIAYYDIVKNGVKLNKTPLTEVKLLKVLDEEVANPTCRKLKQEFYRRLDEQRQIKGFVMGGSFVICNSGELHPIKD